MNNYIQDLDFSSLQLSSAVELVKCRPLPDGTLSDKQTRRAFQILQHSKYMARGLREGWQTESAKTDKMRMRFEAAVQLLGEHGVQVDTIDWSERPAKDKVRGR